MPPLGREEMYGLQYSVLPRERVRIGEVWKQLNMDDEAQRKGIGMNGFGNVTGKARNLTNGLGKRWR